MAGDNRFVTENFLRLNFTPKSGVTPGTDDVRWMDCDQIIARYDVTISGVTGTGKRWPSQNQVTTSLPTVVTDNVTELWKYLFSNPHYYWYHNRYGGNVTSEGSSAVTARGILYSTLTSNPTIGGSGVTQKSNGSGTGSFSADEYGLTHGTTYYFRAYAINSSGTAYGNVVSFTIGERPSATNQGLWLSRYTYNGVNYSFDTLAAAQTALYNHKYNSANISGWSGNTLYSASLGSGESVYVTNNAPVSLDRVSSYWVDNTTNAYRILYAIDGVLQSVTSYNP